MQERVNNHVRSNHYETGSHNNLDLVKEILFKDDLEGSCGQMPSASAS
jgi:hypothetical protein